MIMAKKTLCPNSNYFHHILLYFIPMTWFDEILLYVKNYKVDFFTIMKKYRQILHCKNSSKTICIPLHIIFPQTNSYPKYSSRFHCNLFLVICLFFSSCQSCIEATKCGFCYTEEGKSAVNGSCLPYKETAYSSIGRCNSTELPSDLVWADNFCPSSYSWMGLLGLVIYLMAFAPGNGDCFTYFK